MTAHQLQVHLGRERQQAPLVQFHLKEKIKKAQITSTRSWSSLEASVEGDILKLDADPSYERSDGSVSDYSDRIRTTLEAAL